MTQNEWIIYGSTGTSSKTMWAAINDVIAEDKEIKKGWYFDVPYDPSDFSRCLSYVNQTGLTLIDLQKVKDKFSWWSPFIDNWQKLVELYLSEHENERMTETYNYIQILEEQSKILAGWEKVNDHSWRVKDLTP